MPEMPSLLGAWRSFWARRSWDDRHRRLAALPALGGWGREDIRELVAHGDEVAVPKGDVLLVEDMIGYWFVLVVEGTLAVGRDARRLGSLGPGAHVGEVAILGFGPQPATVTAATDCRVFVMGRRELLSMVDRSSTLRSLLFPDVPAEEFRPFLRRLRRDGTDAWRRLPQPVRERASRPPTGIRAQRPGRLVTTNTAFSRLAAAAFRRADAGTPAAGLAPIPSPISGRAITALVAACALAALVAAGLFHPPVVVVSLAEPIDVTADVSVPPDRATAPVTGRYLLTAVDLRQPTLVQAVLAKVRGQQVLPLSDPSSAHDAVAAGRATFARSQELALAAAADALALDARAGAGLTIVPQDRNLQGPSAALVYALVAADIMSDADLAGGRRVAATGTLAADGTIGAVGFSEEKYAAAARAGADVFVVPASQHWPARSDRMRVIRVGSLREAIAALADPNPVDESPPRRSRVSAGARVRQG